MKTFIRIDKELYAKFTILADGKDDQTFLEELIELKVKASKKKTAKKKKDTPKVVSEETN